MTADDRAAFEAWAREYLTTTEPMAGHLKNNPLRLHDWLAHDRYHTDRYQAPWTDSAWSGWQAAVQAERSRCARAAPVAYSEGRTLSWHKGRGVTNAQLYAAPVDLTAIIDEWLRPDHINLHAGEMTVRELRTVLAVVKGIKADIEGTK